MPTDLDVMTDSSPVAPDVKTAAESSTAAPDSDKGTSSTPEAASPTPAEPKSLLEAVQKAVTPEKAPDQVDAPPKEAAPVTSDQKEGEQPPEVSVDEKDYAKEPFGKHPRFRALLGETKRLRALEAEYKESKESFEKSKDTVDHFTKFRESVQAAGLSGGEVSEGFTIMALMKSDPAQALPMLRAKVKEIEDYLGMTLPEDIQSSLDQGLISEAHAQELAQARAKASNAEMRGKQMMEQATQRDADAANQARGIAASAWERQWKATDPDYAQKASFVQAELVRLVNTEGPGRTPEDAVALCKKARRNVEDRLAQLMPRKQTVKANGQDDNVPGPVKKPITLFEAVAQAANG